MILIVLKALASTPKPRTNLYEFFCSNFRSCIRNSNFVELSLEQNWLFGFKNENSFVFILGFGLTHIGRRPIRRLVRGRLGPIPSPVDGSSSEIDVAKVQGRVQGGGRLGLQQRRNLCSGTAFCRTVMSHLIYSRVFMKCWYFWSNCIVYKKPRRTLTSNRGTSNFSTGTSIFKVGN